ncbi:MAG TPA: ester cyclase [Gemmatimonadales bacterium]|nr:ester cyclase [Gemmatimonadales bacterium]
MPRSPLAAALVLLTLLACKAAPPAEPAKAPEAPAVDPVAVVDAYMAGWNAHDAAKAASQMADDVVYYDATVGVPQVSRDSAQKNVIQAFLTAAPDCSWVRDSTPPIVGHDGIAFTWTFSGTHTGPFADGTKATGKKFSFKGATVIRLKGDKIAYQGDYYDAYGFLKQLGLAK